MNIAASGISQGALRNKRTSPRFRFKKITGWTFMVNRSVHRGYQIKDISPEGVQIEVKNQKAPEKGKEFNFVLFEKGNIRINVRGTVRWVVPRNGASLVGIQFSDPDGIVEKKWEHFDFDDMVKSIESSFVDGLKGSSVRDLKKLNKFNRSRFNIFEEVPVPIAFGIIILWTVGVMSYQMY